MPRRSAHTPSTAWSRSSTTRPPRPPRRTDALRAARSIPVHQPSEKAAERGEPSYVWRAGQDRRLRMIAEHARDLRTARVLDDGCGIGTYVGRLGEVAALSVGIDFELERARQAGVRIGRRVACAASEHLPFGDRTFDVVLSNEVIEHVQDDREAVAEMARVLRPGGRAIIFCPNRWYPVEQHGVYWRGRYHFGNIPLVNYLPDPLRNRLAPHVRTYGRGRLLRLLQGLPLQVVYETRIFGGYDNLVARFGPAGRLLRAGLQGAERTPARVLGLSHLLVAERTQT